jgi:hypothetical protein
LWFIEDELHAELQDGQFLTREDAVSELRRRAHLPWDTEPNLAPCTSWRTCGRRYELIERSDSEEKSRSLALEISAASMQWHLPEDRETI